MKRKLILSLAMAAAVSGTALAQTPRDLEDLVDIRASSGESELEDRGYFHISTIKLRGKALAYWWNPDQQRCIVATTYDGRYESVLDQPASRCDDDTRDDANSGSSHGGGFDPNDVVGMRASSGERELEDNGYQFANLQKGEDRIWANWWNASEKKCITVVTMNGEYDSVTDTLPFDCEKDSDSSSGSTSSGHHIYAHNFSDLVGARGSSVDMRMDSDGFKAVDNYKGNDMAATWWYSAKTNECVKVEIVEGRVDRIERAPGYPACKP